MRKYLFFDIDGTLRGRSRQINEKTKDALIRLQKEGHRIFLCSGRSPASIKGPILQAVHFDGIIACAGGCILLDDQCIYEHDIPVPLLEKVLQAFDACRIPYSLETRDAIYQSDEITAFFDENRRRHCQDHPEYLKSFEEESRDFVYRPLDQFDPHTVGVPKLCFATYTPESFAGLRPMLEEYFHIVLFTSTKDSLNGELIPRNCTKADGIRRILDYYHADWKDTIAFGDSMNDYQMIQAVHTGVVYEHAPAALKELAKYFFRDPDDAGIYYALADLGLVK